MVDNHTHRLAVHAAKAAAESGEAARRAAHMPDSGHGGEPGVQVDGPLTAADAAALGMSADVVLAEPADQDQDQAADYKS